MLQWRKRSNKYVPLKGIVMDRNVTKENTFFGKTLSNEMAKLKYIMSSETAWKQKKVDFI